MDNLFKEGAIRHREQTSDFVQAVDTDEECVSLKGDEGAVDELGVEEDMSNLDTYSIREGLLCEESSDLEKMSDLEEGSIDHVDGVHYPGSPLNPCIPKNEIASDSASTPDVIGHKRRRVKDNYRACRPKSENKDRGYRVDVPAEVKRCVYAYYMTLPEGESKYGLLPKLNEYIRNKWAKNKYRLCTKLQLIEWGKVSAETDMRTPHRKNHPLEDLKKHLNAFIRGARNAFGLVTFSTIMNQAHLYLSEHPVQAQNETITTVS